MFLKVLPNVNPCIWSLDVGTALYIPNRPGKWTALVGVTRGWRGENRPILSPKVPHTTEFFKNISFFLFYLPYFLPNLDFLTLFFFYTFSILTWMHVFGLPHTSIKPSANICKYFSFSTKKCGADPLWHKFFLFIRWRFDEGLYNRQAIDH